MHKTIKNLLNISEKVKSKFDATKNLSQLPNIIAVSKTFKMDHILPLIKYGHLHYGENKVQEAIEKWTEIRKSNQNIKLHLIGRLQTNKVKFAVKLFDYIHSLDSKKLADKISKFQTELNIKTKLFIQVNIGDEEQKSGIAKENVLDFFKYCRNLNLNIIGLMCIPPINKDTKKYFQEMLVLKKKLDLKELSMGMSSDYLDATEYSATFLRIGSNIFGHRD